MRAATSALALWFAVAVVSHASPSTRQLTPTGSGEWVLGAPGLSCTQACGKFSPCDAGSTEAAHAAFSSSPSYFSIFMQNKFGVTCGNIETEPAACDGEVGPYFNAAKGLCGTSLQTSPVNCGATCVDSIQRICCCGGICPMLPPAPNGLPTSTPTATPTPMPTPTPTPASAGGGWYSATGGVSCTDFCAALGFPCAPDPGWTLNLFAVLQPNSFLAVLNSLGHTCSTGVWECSPPWCEFAPFAIPVNPSCHYSTTANFMFDCSATPPYPQQNRICCCGTDADCPL